MVIGLGLVCFGIGIPHFPPLAERTDQMDVIIILVSTLFIIVGIVIASISTELDDLKSQKQR